MICDGEKRIIWSNGKTGILFFIGIRRNGIVRRNGIRRNRIQRKAIRRIRFWFESSNSVSAESRFAELSFAESSVGRIRIADTGWEMNAYPYTGFGKWEFGYTVFGSLDSTGRNGRQCRKWWITAAGESLWWTAEDECCMLKYRNRPNCFFFVITDGHHSRSSLPLSHSDRLCWLK